MKHLALLLITAAALSAQTTVVGGSGGGSGDVTTTGTQTLTNKTIDGNSNTVQLRRAATDCTAETGGKAGEMCLELDADTLYTCQPTAGDCDTAGEWVLPPAGSVGADQIGTAEIDDASDTPVENCFLAVDAATTGVQYICLSTGFSISGVEYDRVATIAPTVVDTTSAQTLEDKTLTDASLGDDSALTRRVQNDTATGTTVNHLVKIQDDGANAEEAVISTTSNVDKIAGVAIAGAGTTGNVEIAIQGEAQLDMDNACTIGNWVIASTSVNGEGSCTGTKPTTAVQILGIATQTTGGAGLADVWLFGYASDNASDAAAIHDDVSGEIAALTEKASPVSADLLIIEDSEASNAKKKVQIGNLPGGGSDFVLYNFVALPGSPTDGSTAEWGCMLRGIADNNPSFNRCIVAKAGTVREVSIGLYCGSFGTDEKLTVNFNKNLGTTTLLDNSNLAFNASFRTLHVNSLSIALVEGDEFTLQVVNPTFATDPSNCSAAVSVLVEH